MTARSVTGCTSGTGARRTRPAAAAAASVAITAISFAESLWSPEIAPGIHQRAEESLRRGIAAYYRLGQLLAAPMLLERVMTAPLDRATIACAVCFLFTTVILAIRLQ